MKIGIGNDHAAVEMKMQIKEFMEGLGQLLFKNPLNIKRFHHSHLFQRKDSSHMHLQAAQRKHRLKPLILQ